MCIPLVAVELLVTLDDGALLVRLLAVTVSVGEGVFEAVVCAVILCTVPDPISCLRILLLPSFWGGRVIANGADDLDFAPLADASIASAAAAVSPFGALFKIFPCCGLAGFWSNLVAFSFCFLLASGIRPSAMAALLAACINRDGMLYIYGNRGGQS